jgi:hypothetical protein
MLKRVMIGLMVCAVTGMLGTSAWALQAGGVETAI